jgi:hypothetical protein
MINLTYSVRCSECNSSYLEGEESMADLMETMRIRRWTSRRVPNGSIWQVCPNCRSRFEKYPEEWPKSPAVIPSDSVESVKLIVFESAAVMKGHAEYLLKQQGSDPKSVLCANLTLDYVKKMAWVYGLLK